MKADEPRQNRIPFMLSDAELEAIDDWRFANKIATRAEAIRRLCSIGLVAGRVAPDLFRQVREISDWDFMARETMIRTDVSDELRAEIARVVEMRPERAHMILNALMLSKMVSAFQDAPSLQDALERAKAIEAEIANELAHALVELPADTEDEL